MSPSEEFRIAKKTLVNIMKIGAFDSFDAWIITSVHLKAHFILTLQKYSSEPHPPLLVIMIYITRNKNAYTKKWCGLCLSHY